MQPADFTTMLQQYKQVIDDDIAVYVAHVRRTTRQQYGDVAADVTEAYARLLENGGKRIRGALTMVGYEMCGGQDQQMIVRAATAMEMLHAYMLVIDDIQDRSAKRRGQPTVHEQLVTYHGRSKLRGDSAHVGMSLALNAALTGAHAAQMLLAGLSVDDTLKVKVLGIVNLTMVVTAHGQTYDIVNEVAPTVTDDDISKVLEWKTAHYTFLNPLCVGMALAGVGCDDTNAIRDYAIPTGIAFQITDDILGVFGHDDATGKTAMDDIREGKRTLLTQYAAQHAPKNDQAFLLRCLGNDGLTSKDFARCQAILEQCGARDYATTQAQQYIAAATAALRTHGSRWNTRHVQFLEALAQQLLVRVH